jgi:hypothetical protein
LLFKSTRLWRQAYEGLQTAERLRENYTLVPAKVKDVYLVQLLGALAELSVRSAIIFCSTCKVPSPAPLAFEPIQPILYSIKKNCTFFYQDFVAFSYIAHIPCTI